MVAVRYRASGTHDGPFDGIVATGESFERGAMAMVRVAGGVIAEKWSQLDSLSLLDQLGVVDPPSA